jgi:hypothetical protein
MHRKQPGIENSRTRMGRRLTIKAATLRSFETWTDKVDDEVFSAEVTLVIALARSVPL